MSRKKWLMIIFREPEYVELESTDEYVKVPVRIGPDKTYQWVIHYKLLWA